MKRKALSVCQVNQYIKSLLENDAILCDLFVEAEISNFKPHTSGHLYFTLKDEAAALNCIMFRSHAQNLSFELRNGMKVLAYGRVSLYEKTGAYQLYAEYLQPSGIGGLALAFEQLKEKLSKQGIFDISHKKIIPKKPNCVAVITSPTGAAVRDILQIAGRRNPGVKIVILPVLVQGKDAAKEISEAIANVNKWGKADTIIVGRGGGSMEDLWAFNEEIVARSIYNSEIPVISAVGHETDFTIADFAADLRAPTPSAAAELAIPSLSEMKGHLQTVVDRLTNACLDYLDYKKQYISLQNNLFREVTYLMEKNRLKFREQVSKLEVLSPLAVLHRGYAIVKDKDGQLVSGARNIKQDEELEISFHDGSVKTIVSEAEYYGEEKTYI